MTSETCLVLSGKGGVGKITVFLNVATSIAMVEEKTEIIDTYLPMTNLGLAFGLQDMPITLHEVLAGKAPISKAIHDDLKKREDAMKIVPHVTYIPESPASNAMTKLAANNAKVEYKPTIEEVGWFQKPIGKSRIKGIENYGPN